MSTKHLLFVGVVAVVAMIIYYTFMGAQIDSGYAVDLQRFRTERDSYFKTDADSPLDKAQRGVFEGLSYFPANPAYRVKADLEWANSPEEIRLPTTDSGEEQLYLKVVQASFALGGENHTLWLLQQADTPASGKLQLLFRDASSGKSTYGAGRYLEVETRRKKTCILDFNRAYNPYCAYNSYYICPLPPPENTLPIAIEAGEKLPISTMSAKH